MKANKLDYFSKWESIIDKESPTDGELIALINVAIVKMSEIRMSRVIRHLENEGVTVEDAVRVYFEMMDYNTENEI